MKATFKRNQWIHKTGVTRGFVWAVLLGGEVKPIHENPNTPGDMSSFDDDSLRLVIEEGREQAQRQNERFRHATDRAQILLTVDLALLGFLAALLHHLLGLHGTRELISIVIWIASVGGVVFGTAAAAGVVVVAARFGGIDTTIMSNMPPPVMRELASSYSSSVRNWRANR